MASKENQILESFPIIEFMASMENHYVHFSTFRQTIKICKISVSTLYHENFEHLLFHNVKCSHLL